MTIAATDEKTIVTIALKMAGGGSSYDGIALHLNEEGYLTTSGNEWSGSTVSALLVKNGFRKRAPAKAAAKETPPASQSSDLLNAVAGVLGMKGMTSDLKVETALFLLTRGGSNGEPV
jgi:hypothetical protein